jgi:ubiquitin thioesterase OTU1
VVESPLGEGDIPVEPKETIKMPGDAGHLQLRVVPDDNSCLFSAIGVVFEGGISAAQKLRTGEARPFVSVSVLTPYTVVADAIKADPVNYSDVILG